MQSNFDIVFVGILKLKTKANKAQKMKFCIKVFFSKRDQIHKFLPIRSDLLKKSLMEDIIFCVV